MKFQIYERASQWVILVPVVTAPSLILNDYNRIPQVLTITTIVGAIIALNLSLLMWIKPSWSSYGVLSLAVLSTCTCGIFRLSYLEYLEFTTSPEYAESWK